MATESHMQVDAFNELRSDIGALSRRMDGMANAFRGLEKEIDVRLSANANKSELLDKAPPFDLNAERAVLACILLDPWHCWEPARDQLSEHDFGDFVMKQIYAAMLWLDRNGKKPDSTLLIAQLTEDGQYGTDDGVKFIDLFDLLKLLPLVANLPYYIERLKEMSHRRHAVERGIQLVQAAHNRLP